MNTTIQNKIAALDAITNQVHACAAHKEADGKLPYEVSKHVSTLLEQAASIAKSIAEHEDPAPSSNV